MFGAGQVDLAGQGWGVEAPGFSEPPPFSSISQLCGLGGGLFNAVLAPQAGLLIAFPIVGSGKAIIVAFLQLDGPDELYFRQLAGFDALGFGYLSDFFHVHCISSCPCIGCFCYKNRCNYMENQ